MHLDQEQIERLVHDEADAHAHEHVAVCEQCRTRVIDARNLESDVFDLLTQLDRPAPTLSAMSLIESARGQERSLLPWAAGIVVALGIAGAAVALPGSPVRKWLDSRREPDPPASLPPASPAAPNSATGIAVAPGHELVIEFQKPQARGLARVRLTDGDEVTVRSLAGSATFTSALARLLIENPATGDFEIDLPRAAPRVVIMLGNRQLLLKNGATINSSGTSYSTDSYVLDLTVTSQ